VTGLVAGAGPGAPDGRAGAFGAGPETGAAAPALRARALGKVYFPGTPDELAALGGIDASFETGEVHLIWGASGSGKTTLLSLLGGLDEPTSGEVIAFGQVLGELTEPRCALYRRRTVGFLFQSPTLLPGVPVWANVSLALIPDGWPDAARREAAAELLRELGLLEKIDRTPEQLSGGEAHRVSLARALVRQPPILLADEPTSQLDAANAGRVLDTLAQRAGSGTVVVVASHDPEVRRLATRVTELADGRIHPGAAAA
jgi:ABC-type lipoprotein export system ATPase subunit